MYVRPRVLRTGGFSYERAYAPFSGDSMCGQKGEGKPEQAFWARTE
ncbi:Hypothetical protein XNRR2_3229 [Streptomyces albidoflavus]|uniref:Uncharacterized protein n=1 Tax=Streptomyces albidoflavus TaxID=1886 RepID=A0AA37C154_9ACTN|nr:Hypothetical protein XNR_3229 [Streptomyces albidoflavus]BDH52311.1 hypothetical protein MTP02_33220 [Streptomyces albus]BDH69323.1 hypothetical protein MTP06_27720 [Streptomyces sp. PLM4]QLP93425.1 Hypothetical protein XNRR2_3229 [Streptomyces albidoflavus]WAE11765.1 Hypothetical protein SAD14_3229 [Streptomyces albidoflavus]